MTIIKGLLGRIDCQNQLGENPLWHPSRKVLCWIDIEGASFFEYDLSTKTLSTIPLPYRIGSFGFTQTDHLIVAAFEQGFALFDLLSKSIEWLAQPEVSLNYTRFNDGRTDRQGRFWAGTMVEPERVRANTIDTHETSQAGVAGVKESIQKGSLYCLNLDRSCTKVISDIDITNGLCWSLDSRVMYHADSPHQLVSQYSFDPESAQISDKKPFISTQHKGYPDGGIVDKYGRYWHARWADSKVACMSPTGEVIEEFVLPVSQPSSLCIGGPNMDILFVTSASVELSSTEKASQAFAGDVFIIQLNGPLGVAESICLLV